MSRKCNFVLANLLLKHTEKLSFLFKDVQNENGSLWNKVKIVFSICYSVSYSTYMYMGKEQLCLKLPEFLMTDSTLFC